MITPAFSLTTTERVLPMLALDFTTATLDSRVSFTRTTNSTNPATYVNSSGLVTAATDDQPRFDYDPVTLACKGLLIEESRANLLTYSNDFSNAAWTKGAINLTTAAVTSPDGTTNATKAIPNTTSTSLHRVYLLPTGTNTFSVYAKAGEYYGLRLFADGFDAKFNLSNGTLASGTGTITPAGNGWYRCSASGTITSAQICVYPTESVVTYTGDGISGIYIWGAQLEAGAFATSYIPTTTTALTRNADVATITGTNFSSFWQASKGGVLVRARPGTVSGTRPWVQFDDGTTDEIIALRGNATNPELYIVDGGAPQAQIDAGTIAAGTSYRLAGTWAANNCAASLNSGTPVLDTTVNLPSANQLRLGSDGTNYLNGHLESIEYYDQRISNASLQMLSSSQGFNSLLRPVFVDSILSERI